MKVKDGIVGLVVGDALGVPVEFSTRAARERDPVREMRGYGTHDQPEGTWSDDSAMTIATMTSITNKNGIDYTDIMDEFVKWYSHDEHTNSKDGRFDVGNSTAASINRYISGTPALNPEEGASVTTETDL